MTPDPDEAATNTLDPLVPRAIDLPTIIPLDGVLDPEAGDIAKIFAAPDDSADVPAWRAALATWREAAAERIGYRGDAYDEEPTRWAATCYSVALVWLWDERLFDHDAQRFTVDRFLAATADHGGFDGVVLWHAYPVIGIDDRNQYDFYRDIPGIARLIAEFHGHGIRVFADYNPWDVGTRRADAEDPEALAALVRELGVDGVFLDTMKEGGAELITALRGTHQALEGESRIPLARIEDHQLSWAQWFADSEAPGVLRAHWFERRHMMHHTRRWNRDHSDELHSSWMNGTGILVWDAVFGSWVGWNERDRSTLRRMLRVQRAASELLIHGEWTPLVEVAPVAVGIHASAFERDGVTLWTLVNRGTDDYRGPVVDGPQYDVTAGAAVTGDVFIPARGVTGLLAGEPPWLGALLETADAPATDSTFPERLLVRTPTPAAVISAAPLGSIVLEPGEHDLSIRYRRRETGMLAGAPYVEEWKPLPPRLHDECSETSRVTIGHVAVAGHEVTRDEFAAFVALSGYRPLEPNRFLVGEGVAATGVSLTDARSYAAWVGGRLPTEHEWQLAAGSEQFGRIAPLVWNLTESEHTDGVTRFVLLKGGSASAIEESDWYFDGGPQEPDWVSKLLLAGLGLERSSSIGFRLAWDLA